MFAQSPPIIKGNTISNLILVNYLELNEKTEEYEPNKDTYAYVEPYNSRDIFLNVNSKKKDDNENFKLYTRSIIHEVTHNILLKHINEKASKQLDNLFYNSENHEKIANELFEVEILQNDFWLNNMETGNY